MSQKKHRRRSAVFVREASGGVFRWKARVVWKSGTKETVNAAKSPEAQAMFQRLYKKNQIHAQVVM